MDECALEILSSLSYAILLISATCSTSSKQHHHAEHSKFIKTVYNNLRVLEGLRAKLMRNISKRFNWSKRGIHLSEILIFTDVLKYAFARINRLMYANCDRGRINPSKKKIYLLIQ